VCRKLTIWKNVEGQNKAIRTHLHKHGKHWLDIVVSKKLKGWKTIRLRSKNSTSEEHPREPFTLEGFLDRLVRWVTVDDQVRAYSLNTQKSPLIMCSSLWMWWIVMSFGICSCF
jgi:hypothetical protein